MTNTYHAQTAKFLAKVAENMPALPADIMQGWIENPKALREVLEKNLMPVRENVQVSADIAGTNSNIATAPVSVVSQYRHL